MKSFEDKVAVVTGAGSGIGLAMSRRLVQAGARVVMSDIDESSLESASRELTRLGEVKHFVTDVSDPRSVEELATHTIREFGKVHLLVNNAGVTIHGRLWELGLDDWTWVNGVCFWGVVNGIRSFLPSMLAHGEEGHVVNVSSMAGLISRPRCGPYDSAKAGVIAVTESLAFELAEIEAPLGVTLLCPGYTATDIGNSARHRPMRFGDSSQETSASAQLDSSQFTSPDSIAELALNAVIQQEFYALADWSVWRPIVDERFTSILDCHNPEAPIYP